MKRNLRFLSMQHLADGSTSPFPSIAGSTSGARFLSENRDQQVKNGYETLVTDPRNLIDQLRREKKRERETERVPC